MRKSVAPGLHEEGRPTDAAAEVDRLWLETLGRVVSRAAHEVKNALNGVSVNLEVVRSRAERPEAPASAVQRFADTASSQLEAVIRLNEALLSVARPVRGPVDVAVLLGRLTTLLAPAAAAEGGGLVVVDEGRADGEAGTALGGNVVRLGLAASLLAALERKAVTTCRVERGEDVVIRLDTSAGGRIALPPAITEALVAAGVRMDDAAEGCSLAFPRAGAPAASPRAHIE